MVDRPGLILAVPTKSGVSQIRYRAYQQGCPRSSLQAFFSWKDQSAPPSNETLLISTYQQLIEQKIPCMWQMRPVAKPNPESSPEADNVILELWVFWFDDRHTGIIDGNASLKELDELRVGSFTWESVTAKNTHRTNACALVTVVIEYKLFMKALRNLIVPYMIKLNAMPLGDFFIFPPGYLEPTVGENDSSINRSTSLCCTYNIYLISTNLIFQPSSRRIRLRHLSSSDLQTKAKVLLSPTGEQALLMPTRHSIPTKLETQILQQWSALLQIPMTNLAAPSPSSLPLVSPIRIGSGDVIYFPSRLVFVLTPTKYSPSAMAGMNGTLGYNHGLVEDLAQKWNREMWISQVLTMQSSKASRHRIDYWSYNNPRLHTTLTALDSLATTAIQPASNDPNSPMLIHGGVLVKAMSEPILSSPLMASKSVATPSSPLPKDDWDAQATSQPALPDQPYPSSSTSVLTQSFKAMPSSLTDFVQQYFTTPPASTPSLSDVSMQMNGNSLDLLQTSAQTHGLGTSPLLISQQAILPLSSGQPTTPGQQPPPPPPQPDLILSYGATNPTPTLGFPGSGHPPMPPTQMQPSPLQQQPSPQQQPDHKPPPSMPPQQQPYQDPSFYPMPGAAPSVPVQHFMEALPGADSTDTQAAAPSLDLSVMESMDAISYDVSGTWADDDLDKLELDLDVTEEDFDFFETAAPKPRPPADLTKSMMAPMDFLPVKQEDQMLLDSLDFGKPDVLTNDALDELLDAAPPGLSDPMLDAHVKMEQDAFAIDMTALHQDEAMDLAMDDALLATAATASSVLVDPTDNDDRSSDPQPLSPDRPTLAHLEPAASATDKTPGRHLSPTMDREQRLVPPSFAPLAITNHVNNAKYMQGGKFTYVPGADLPTTDSKKRPKKKDRGYRPDYVPVTKKKKKTAAATVTTEGNDYTTVTNLSQPPNPSLVDKDGDHVMAMAPPAARLPGKASLSRRTSTTTASGTSTSTSDSDSDSDSSQASDTSSSTSTSSSSGLLRAPKTTDNVSEEGEIPAGGLPVSSSTVSSCRGPLSRAQSDDSSSHRSSNQATDDQSMPMDSGHATPVRRSRLPVTTAGGDSHAWHEEQDPGRLLDTLAKACTIYLHRLIGDIKVPHGGKRRYVLDKLDLDYDTPFSDTVAPSSVQPERYTAEDEPSLQYLCQQAVLGGYPFFGGLAEISTNGGEVALGESTRIIISRHCNLLQNARGGTTHVPSLTTDYGRVLQDFKGMLGDIFDPQASIVDEPMAMADTPEFTSSVSVNGPLNIQQYYELSESNQTHSKYGKYQVKKKRPLEPNFDTLHSPDIVVSRHDEFIEGSPKLIGFWEKLRLEPYSAKKNISYFVVFPSNEELETTVQTFMKNLSSVYETCCLGTHHAGYMDPFRRGSASVPLLPEEPGESRNARQRRSYMKTCEQLGATLGGVMAENVYIVIYMVNPSPHLSSSLQLSRCYDQLVKSFERARQEHIQASLVNGTRVPSDKTRARLVLQLLPIEHVVRCSEFGTYTKSGLKEIAFSVYGKCPTIVTNPKAAVLPSHPPSPQQRHGATTREIYSPPFVLTKQVPEQITFSLNASVRLPAILDQDATLHMAYVYSLDRRWMTVVWTDHRGELVDHAVLRASGRQAAPFTVVFEEAWKKSKAMAAQADFDWTFVIVKLGLMFENELQAWVHVIPDKEKVAIVCMDMESSLNVDNLGGPDGLSPANAPDTPQTPQTPNVGPNHVSTPPPSSSANTPVSQSPAALSMNKQAAVAASTLADSTTIDTAASTTITKILLLNHRVAYSRKRHRVSEGVTLMDAISDIESWILPLSSGYLIHMPKPGAPTPPTEEQFGRSPCILEMHLIYNQTQHSSYTTLRDIIKRYHALSFVNLVPSSYNCLPIHIVLADRLWRLLLVVDY
ncbi:hypothetical protein DM01DRAFT_1385988 [Hesseltinella vesiculosa]|uniref:Mediator of RNA polymerase II transcription subunit 13 n=1 Tax=Hesseltinella vesiculosa TaxID=101127 RepID=A0A1X2G907_9FUNG|nr:hypothetical protein DM01DRAFT_1385988 [Hesseltinella vesiculosa]